MSAYSPRQSTTSLRPETPKPKIQPLTMINETFEPCGQERNTFHTSVSTSGVRPLRLPTFINLRVAKRASSLANWTLRIGFLPESQSQHLTQPIPTLELEKKTYHCISPRCFRCRSLLRLRYSRYCLSGFLLLVDLLVAPVAPVAALSMDDRRAVFSLPCLHV